MEEEVFTISITVSQPAAKIDGTVEIVDDYGLSIVASQQGVELEGVAMSEISQTALIAFGQWYKGDSGRDGDDGRDGTDGFSPVVTVTPTEDGHEVTITDASGDHTFDVNDGVGIPQTLSLDGNELSLSDGGGTVTLPDGLPSQSGQNGKFLKTNGSEAFWDEVPEQVNADWEATSGPSEILHKPTLGTASALDVAESGNASTTQVVKGDDTRLSDSRNAADVYPWAKANTKPSYTASEVGAIASSEKGANNGVAELDATGKVPSSQLPSYVDDVLEYASLSAFPATGESGKIYIALDTNKTYRWGGSSYTEISASLALGDTSSTAYAGNKGKANADAISAIKDGTSIDSFGDVENALADKINKSSTSGLVKNDGTIDTNTYLTQHQDISGKADKVSNATNGNFAALDSNGNITDSGHKHSDYLTSQVNADWDASSGAAQILNKPTLATVATSGSYNDLSNTPTIPDAVSGTNDGTNWTSITIGDTTKAIPSGGGGGGSSTLSGLDDTSISSPSGGQVLKYNNSSSKWENANETTELPSITGNSSKVLAVNSGATGVEWVTPASGLTNHNFTHTANTTISGGTTTVTFAANTRGSQMITVSDDISIAFVVNNDSDNYLWIENSDTTNNIDVTISSVTHNGNVVSNVRMPRYGIAVPAVGTCEIGIVCNTDGAFITSRDDLE